LKNHSPVFAILFPATPFTEIGDRTLEMIALTLIAVQRPFDDTEVED
jgi:hypothetical protein